MKPTEGFLAEDGTFFESSIDCELYEATNALDAQLVKMGIDPDAFKTALGGSYAEANRWVNAVIAKGVPDSSKPQVKEKVRDRDWKPIPGAGTAEPDDPGPDYDIPDDLGPSEHADAEDVAEAVFEQPLSFSEPMSPMGSGLSAEAISYLGKELGIRVRGSDAPSLRSRPDLAVMEGAETKGPRDGERAEDIRK